MENIINIKSVNNNYYIYNVEQKVLQNISPITKYFLENKITELNNCLIEFLKNEYKTNLSNINDDFKFSKFLIDSHIYENKQIYKEQNITITKENIKQQIKNLKNIIIEITDFCNNNCYYCTYGPLYKNNDTRQNGPISFKVIENLLLFLDKNNTFSALLPTEINIGFYGGEPLLEIDLIKKVVYLIKNKYIRKNITFTFSLTTNGVLLNSENIDFLVENEFELLVSLDGNLNHNSYRTLKSGSNCFEIVIENIENIKLRHGEYFDKKVNFNAVLTNINPKNEVLHFFKEKYNKIPSYQSVSYTDINQTLEESLLEILPNNENNPFLKINDFIPFITTYNNNIYSDYSHLLSNNNSQKKYLSTGTCMPFSRKIFLKSNGLILQCEKIADSYSIGKIDAENVDINFELIAEKFNFHLRNIFSLCNKCYNQFNCMHCVIETEFDLDNGLYCSDYLTKDKYSNLLKNYISEYENFNNKEEFNVFSNFSVII